MIKSLQSIVESVKKLKGKEVALNDEIFIGVQLLCGHGEDNIKLLNKYGIKYNIVKTYPNGVRVGSVEGHKKKDKSKNNGQTWFPKSWTSKDIQKAGTHVASLKSNKHIGDGHNMYGMWKSVRVVVKKTNGKISTIFPDKKQPSKKNKSK